MKSTLSEKVSFQLKLVKWSIRIVLFIAIFFVVVLSAKWIIALSNQSDSTTSQSNSTTNLSIDNTKRIEHIEQATPTPTPKSHKHYKIPEKSLWYRIWHP